MWIGVAQGISNGSKSLAGADAPSSSVTESADRLKLDSPLPKRSSSATWAASPARARLVSGALGEFGFRETSGDMRDHIRRSDEPQ